jgi:hypothetical protein
MQGASARSWHPAAASLADARTGAPAASNEKTARIAPDGLHHVADRDAAGGPAARGRCQFHLPMAAERFSETLSRKPVVESHFWSAPMSRARSLVM